MATTLRGSDSLVPSGFNFVYTFQKFVPHSIPTSFVFGVLFQSDY